MVQPTSPSSSRRGLRSRLIFGVAWWAALFALWLLLVESVATAELMAGVVASALAASVAEAVREREYVRFAPAASWLRFVPRLVWQVLEDCWILGVALARQLAGGRPARGVISRVPMRYGDDSGRAAARRALLNFGISITPNSYVIDFDAETSTAVLHQLVAGHPDPLLGDADAGDGGDPPVASS